MSHRPPGEQAPIMAAMVENEKPLTSIMHAVPTSQPLCERERQKWPKWRTPEA